MEQPGLFRKAIRTKFLRGVFFINADTGTVVGDDGTIIRTTDGGTTWTPQTSGVTTVLRCVFFSNADSGTVVGEFGTILKTTNGGSSWTKENSPTTLHLLGVFYSDANNGTIVGHGGTILTNSTPAPGFVIANLKVYLEGPYNGSAMTTTLNSNNLIPLNSEAAYDTAAYGYTASVVGSIPNSDIVDWVLVELRTGTGSGTKVAERAVFIKSDGTIVDTDGSSPVTFSGLSNGNYYVVIQPSKSSCNYDCISNFIKQQFCFI